MRISEAQRRDTEQRIRAAALALLRGELPPGGTCDTTTLARLAGISRATLYRSYPHLKAEFDQQLADLRAAGRTVDPRDAQISRLKHDNADLQRRLADRDAQHAEHEAFKTLAISRLAAQHDEIHRLRAAVGAAQAGTVRALPTRRPGGLVRPC
jgi:AcrR family transcriptional regulator